MALEVIIRGKLGKDCPKTSDIEELKRSIADVVRKKLRLRPEDKVIIEFTKE